MVKLEPIEQFFAAWFSRMAIRHCGKDYGNERHNAYHFYRRVYGMTASEALATVNRWRIGKAT